MQRLQFTYSLDVAADGGKPAARLYRLEGSTKVSVPFDVERIDDFRDWIEPTVAQPVGTALVLEYDRPSGCAVPQSTYTVTEAKPLPTTLGTLTSSLHRGDIEVGSGASCSETIDASYTDFRVQLSAEALPYASLFSYASYVDGTRYLFSGNTATGEGRPQGEQRTFTICDQSDPRWLDDLAPGTHRIRFEATLPDGTKLSTPEISFEQACAGGTSSDAGLDAAAPPGKSDSGLQGGVDSGMPGSKAEDDGCSLAARRGGMSGLLVALALLLRRRRTR